MTRATRLPPVARKAVLTAALTTTLASCAAPRSDVTIAPVDPATLGLTPVVGAAAVPAIDAAWWRGFGDPQLDRLVAAALAGNPTLDAALARVRRADAALSGQQAGLRPDATLDASLQVTRLPGRYIIPPPYGGSVRTIGQGLGNLRWTLDLFGRQQAAITGAQAGVRAATLDAAAARLALAGAVVQAYIGLAQAETQIAIARSTITQRAGSLRLVQVQQRNKLASGLQATAASTLLAQAQGALAAATGERALAVDALAALTGRGADAAATIAPTRLNLDAGLMVPSAIPADLLGRRADIAAARARVEQAAAGRQVARRAFYPNVNLSARAGSQAVGLDNLVALDSGTVGAGPAISLPIFDGGRRRADLDAATADVDLTTADYNDRVIGAVREAADAIARIRSLGEQRVRAAAVVQGFAETGRLNAVRVASGLESQLGLVDNDVRLLDARRGDAILAADAARARVELVLALGGGFSSEGTR